MVIHRSLVKVIVNKADYLTVDSYSFFLFLQIENSQTGSPIVFVNEADY